MFEIIRKSSKGGNYIVTTAVGKKYLDYWKIFALPLWEKYAQNYDLGIIVLDEEIDSKNSPTWKKINWQKLLILSELEMHFSFVKNVCLLDTDILINPFAPNIFESYKEDSIGLISKRKNMPYPFFDCMKRVSFYRNKFYSKEYPLDSGIFISTEDLYIYHDLTPQEDYACTGVIVLNVNNHAEFLKSIYYKYDQNVSSITNDGEQTHLNFEFQSNSTVQWFDYRFQAIWLYEMAWNYPFLYEKSQKSLTKKCIESSLISNYFIHFAGSWPESDMWKIKNIFDDFELLENYSKYLAMPVSGRPLGMIKP
jgi:hypothetical protein